MDKIETCVLDDGVQLESVAQPRPKPEKGPNDGPDGSVLGPVPSDILFSILHRGPGCPFINSAEIPK